MGREPPVSASSPPKPPFVTIVKTRAGAASRWVIFAGRGGRIKGGMITATSRSSPPLVWVRTASARRVRSFYLRGPAGRLEAVINEGSPDAAFAAIVAHPHPLGGGSLHNKVVYHAMKVM